jgi:hypothetical protein
MDYVSVKGMEFLDKISDHQLLKKRASHRPTASNCSNRPYLFCVEQDSNFNMLPCSVHRGPPDASAVLLLTIASGFSLT